MGEDIGQVVVRLVSSIKRRRASSSCLSCNLWLLARFVRCCKAKGGSNARSVRCRTREQATNVRPCRGEFFLANVNYHLVQCKPLGFVDGDSPGQL